jgi:hypothetical protein
MVGVFLVWMNLNGSRKVDYGNGSRKERIVSEGGVVGRVLIWGEVLLSGGVDLRGVEMI